MAASHAQRSLGVEQTVAQTVPAGDLLLAAARVLIERDAETFDQIGPVALDEPRHVLGEVLARLGDEVTESAEHLITHGIGEFRHSPIGPVTMAAVRNRSVRPFGERRVQVDE